MTWRASRIVLVAALHSAATLHAADATPISYDALPDDRGIEAPFAFALATPQDDYQAAAACAAFTATVDHWAPAQADDLQQRVTSLLALLALGDLCRKPYESQAPLVVQQRLTADIPKTELLPLLAHAIREPQQLAVLTDIPEFHLQWDDANQVRQRMVIYATKLHGRLSGYLPKQAR